MRRCLLALLCAISVPAADHFGNVKFGGVPVPGVTVTASQGGTKLSTITDDAGIYNFTDIAEGTWNLQVEMQMFEPQQRSITVREPPSAIQWVTAPSTPATSK